MPETYVAFDLSIESQFDLPPLPAGTGPPEIRLRLASLPNFDWDARTSTHAFQVHGPKTYLAGWKDLLTLKMIQGHTLLADPAPDLQNTHFRQAVLGIGLGLLMRTRYPLVLHASCVARNGAGLILAGPKGSGKSTLAAHLCERGWRLISDDVVPIRLTRGEAHAVPSFPQIKLQKEVARRVSLSATHREVAELSTRKHLWTIPDHFCAEPVPVRAAAILEHSDSLDAHPLTGSEATRLIASQLYAPRLIGRWGMECSSLLDCASLADGISVSRVTRPDGRETIPAVVEILTDVGLPA